MKGIIITGIFSIISAFVSGYSNSYFGNKTVSAAVPTTITVTSVGCEFLQFNQEEK